MKVFKNQRKIGASCEDIFKAIEDPALLAKWWGPAGFNCTFETFEFTSKGKWSFVMHGPDGADYPNENLFQEIVKPNKVVVRHNENPFFTVTLVIKAVDGGAVITWIQDFDDEKVADNIAHIIEPANEQILDKLQAIVKATKALREKPGPGTL